jgi:hypothetical protein
MFSLSSCEENKENDINNSKAGELPLLAEGNKIGMIKGFNPTHPPATEDSIDARWNEAIDAGMPVGRLQIDWPELEPEPNHYDKAALEDRLKDFQNQNLQTFLLISAYDSDGPVVPSDLEGLKFDNQTLIDRFNNLMDWVIPMLTEYDGYIISVTNEADNHFGEVDNLHNEILTFLQKTKAHIHSINDEMAVTITMAEGSLDENKPGINAIIEASDVVCWNFYGGKSLAQEPFYTHQTESEIKSDIQRMLNRAGNKNIVIQELGMWSGDDVLDSSEEIQRKFFEVFFSELEKEERIRAAYVFQLVDWSPELTEAFNNMFFEDEEIPQSFLDSFAESLETIGLIHYSNGLRKPAWNEFIKWIKKLNN